MENKSQMTAIAPEVVVYTQLKLPSEVSAEGALSDILSNTILLDAQGEAVEVSEEYPIPILMAVFDVVHKVSPEMILRLKTGKRILLFDHWGAPVIRDENIEIISYEVEHKIFKEFVAETVIDVENIWREMGAEENDLDAISRALKKIAKHIKPAMITTLVGKAPALLFLFVQHALYGKTGEIWYQENFKSKAVRITRL